MTNVSLTENQCGYDRPARSYALLRIRLAALIPQPSALVQGFPFHGLLSATVLRNSRRLLNTTSTAGTAGLCLTLYVISGDSTLNLFELNHLSSVHLLG